MLKIQQSLSRRFYMLLSLPSTAMGFALSVQISALSWLLSTQYGLDIHEIGIVWAAGPIAGILGQVIVGFISDKVWFWNGRRRPFILIGGVLASLSLLALPNIGIISESLGGIGILAVAIAIALLHKPDLIIADEPTTALDVTVQLQILELLRQIQGDTGMGMILVTHDLHLVSRFCDDVAIMYAGRIVEAGPVSKVFNAPEHPYTQGLLDAVPTLDQDAERLALIPGNPPTMHNLPGGCRFEPRCPVSLGQCASEYPEWYRLGQDRRVACWQMKQRIA